MKILHFWLFLLTSHSSRGFQKKRCLLRLPRFARPLHSAVKSDMRDSSEHVPLSASHQPAAGTGAVHLPLGSACSTVRGTLPSSVIRGGTEAPPHSWAPSRIAVCPLSQARLEWSVSSQQVRQTSWEAGNGWWWGVWTIPRPSSCLPGPTACSGSGREMDIRPALERVSIFGREGRTRPLKRSERGQAQPGAWRRWGLTAGGLRETSQ